MARTALAPQTIAATGLEMTYAAANVDGHSIVNPDDRTFLHVKNGGGVDRTVTIQTPGTQDGLAVADRAITVTAGEERMIGPFRPRLYNQTSGADAGKVFVDFDAVTSVTVAALRLPAAG